MMSDTGLEYVKQLDHAEALTVLLELCKDKTQREKIVTISHCITRCWS